MSPTADSHHQIRARLIRELWQGHNPYDGVDLALERIDAQGWGGSQHPWLEEVIIETKPEIVIEVGVWKGASAIFMAQALRRAKIPGVIIAVDTWLGSSEHRTNPEWFSSLRVSNGQPTIQQTFMANVISSGLQEYIIPLPLDSLNAAELFRLRGMKADIIHLDAGHDFRSVTTDISSWWQVLRQGGTLIGDDYFPDNTSWPEVKTAFDEFTQANNLAFDLNRPKIRIRKP